MPVRPVVSYVSAPTCLLAIFLNCWFKSFVDFVSLYSLKNSVTLVDKIQNVNPLPSSIDHPSYRLMSLVLTPTSLKLPRFRSWVNFSLIQALIMKSSLSSSIYSASACPSIFANTTTSSRGFLMKSAYPLTPSWFSLS